MHNQRRDLVELLAIAVGSLVTEGLDDDPAHRDSSPYLVWEWLLVESLIRAPGLELGGVPGTMVARRAIQQLGYMDARSYLKTPRVFGFFGVYKRLALRLGIVDVHLGPGLNAERLVDAWASSRDLGGLDGARPLLNRWKAGVKRSLGENPPRTQTGWSVATWAELAGAFVPGGIRASEKRFLREMLLAEADRPLGALPEPLLASHRVRIADALARHAQTVVR